MLAATCCAISSTEALSGAALEVLAIVAYEQPVARADIRSICGVDSDAVVETLIARKLIAEDPRFGGRGRPAFLVTTANFLQRFGLSSLGELPRYQARYGCWTECLPRLHRTQHGVVHALQRARGMFPFALLGINTDNGSEFINEELMACCASEQITFARGRVANKTTTAGLNRKMARWSGNWSVPTASKVSAPIASWPSCIGQCACTVPAVRERFPVLASIQ